MQRSDPLDLKFILHTKTKNPLILNDDKRPMIIISASGMAEAGRINIILKTILKKSRIHYLARRILYS